MLSTCFRRREVVLERARNAELWDRDGKRYIDFLSARSAANLGHCHPEIVAAVEEQARKLIHYTNDLRLEVQEEYSRALERFMPSGLTHHYLCSTGAEAVEAALKLSRARTKKPGAVAFVHAFHGRTLGALSATYKEDYKAPFRPLVEGIRFVSPLLDEVLAALAAEDVGAILFEPVQGESGVRPLGDELIHSLRRVATERGVLLVADEVQSGFGRCGGRFYCDRIGVQPDVLLASKSVAGGMPLAIVATRPELDFAPGEHGSTFSGHPVACAAGLAALRVFERERLELRSLELETRLREQLAPLERIRGVREVRVIGAMVGVEIDSALIDGARVVDECLARGLLVNFTGDTVIRLMPPLTIEVELLREGTAIVRSVLESKEISRTPRVWGPARGGTAKCSGRLDGPSRDDSMTQPSSQDLQFRNAASVEGAAIRALLEASELPTSDIGSDSPQEFLVAAAGGTVVGCVGLERYGDSALLRSLAVAKQRRGCGLGGELYGRMVAHAARTGVKTLYLLTTTAEAFFAKRGFVRIPRTAVPASISKTAEFRSLCPDSAACMKRQLDHEVRHYPADVLQLRPDVPGAAMWAVALDRTMLTHFVVAPGCRFERHTHESEQITFVLEGELIFELEGGERVAVKKGEVIAIPSDVPHAVETGDRGARAVDAWSPVRRDHA